MTITVVSKLSFKQFQNKQFQFHLYGHKQGKLSSSLPLFPSQPQVVIMSDASLRGWGGAIVELDGQQVQIGYMVSSSICPSYNLLEWSGVPYIKSVSVLYCEQKQFFMIDKNHTTVCSYFNKLGGSSLLNFDKKYQNWGLVLEKQCCIVSFHISEERNALVYVISI